MAYRKPTDLDGFIQMMPKADMRLKALLADDLVTFLSDNTNSIVCTDMGLLVDGLMPWLTGSHFKIAQKSLEAFSELIKRLGPDFNAYTTSVLPHVIDRLGDSKDTVREKAQLLLQIIMEYKVLSPQIIIDKLATTCFKHKNAKVREEFLQTVVNTLNEYGTSQLSVRNYIQPICSLLSDPISTVRDTAIQTLVEIYKHVGDRLRPDLRRNDDVPASKLAILEQKFDQIKQEGLLVKSALSTNVGQDEADNIAARDRPTKIVKRGLSATSRLKPAFSESNTNSGDAGSVSMESFESSFEQVPQLNIFNSKDVEDTFRNILHVISDKNMDWEKRVDALKRIRSLLLFNGQIQTQFISQLKDLALAYADVLKDELRSQVIREACITIAYISKVLRLKAEIFVYSILELLILLIQNSAKVISSSSSIAVKYIIKYTHSPKLIKVMTDILQHSKSKDIRSSLCEILCLQFEEWPTKALERNSVLLRDSLKRSLVDADSDARKHSRRAYWLFRRHFPDLADQIYATLDIPAQRALERERDGDSSMPDDRRSTTGAIRVQRSPGSMQKPAAGMRSVSAVDAAAAQRAKVRAQYALYARKKATAAASSGTLPGGSSTQNTGSLPRSRLYSGSTAANSNGAQPGAMAARTRGRAGVSQSQPGSRSTSPSTRLREQQQSYYRPLTGTIPKKASGIPRSLASSRETSPTRVGSSNTMKRSMTKSRRTPDRNQTPRTMARTRYMQCNRETEHAIGDALSPDGADKSDLSAGDFSRGSFSGRGRLGRKLLSRDESDDSEASSVCSDRSFDSSMTRGNSVYNSRNRLDWSTPRAPYDDIDVIIQACASTHWSERKDGLISLTQYLANGKDLTPQQLQCVLDMFRKLFLDSHTKVYSLFLDSVTELILAHADDLHDWLFILLTRLFNKLGAELLNSMNSKIQKTLQVVHEYFPTDLQMKDVFRILSDAAQTPCTKSKIAILRFLTNLATTYCKNSDFPGEENPAQADKAVLKIVQLSGDQKSSELRGQARLCLIALYNCNAPQMTKILSNLPKQYHDSAKNIIQSYLRRSSTSGTNSPSSSPLSSSSPKPLQSPSLGPFSSLQPQFNTSPRSRQSSVDHELYSEVDVQHNIHKTSEEIRNCFGLEPTNTIRQYHSLSHANNSLNANTTFNTSINANTNTNINSNGLNGHSNEHHLDSCTSSNSKTQSTATTESNTPESTTMRFNEQFLDRHFKALTPDDVMNATQEMAELDLDSSAKKRPLLSVTENGELVLENGLTELEVIKIACALTPDMPADHIKKSLSNLGTCIKSGNSILPNKNFKAIMKMLVLLLDSSQSESTIEALHVLSRIVRSEEMRQSWIKFLELILLKIINCYQGSKETAREIDLLIHRIVPALPAQLTIHVLHPVVATSNYPQNLCAVKFVTEVLERHSHEVTDEHLETLFPHLARLTDDKQSMVRKAAVFCIVKFYMVLGEHKVKPKLKILNPSKIRLLNVYIEKQRPGNGGGTACGSGTGSSTKNSSASSS